MGSHICFQPDLPLRVNAATGSYCLCQSSGAAEILVPAKESRGCIGRSGDHSMRWEPHLLQPCRWVFTRQQQLLGIVVAQFEELFQHIHVSIQINKQE
jgi:hypothetical protein